MWYEYLLLFILHHNLFWIDNQIDQAEKEARAAQEKLERLKREKIQGARNVFEKAKAKLKAAKAALNNPSQSSVAGQQPSTSHRNVEETPQSTNLSTR